MCRSEGLAAIRLGPPRPGFGIAALAGRIERRTGGRLGRRAGTRTGNQTSNPVDRDLPSHAQTAEECLAAAARR